MSKDNYDHITDAQLLEKFYSDNNSQWLGIILQRYTLLLLGVCMKYLKNEEEAKDAVQQIFLKAIIELEKYKVTYIKSWLYTIARNHCLMKLRDKKIFLSVENTPEFSFLEPDAIEIHDKEATLTLMELILNELKHEQKTCVTLFYLEKKSYQEIVDATGFDLLQVKSHIQNGKRNIRIGLEKKMKQLS